MRALQSFPAAEKQQGVLCSLWVEGFFTTFAGFYKQTLSDPLCSVFGFVSFLLYTHFNAVKLIHPAFTKLDSGPDLALSVGYWNPSHPCESSVAKGRTGGLEEQCTLWKAESPFL